MSEKSKDIIIKKGTAVSIGTEQIQQMIHIVRGERVILDRDLAMLYGVETKAINKQVQRNIERFPEDFMFQLTIQEYKNLRFQNGTSSWGGNMRGSYRLSRADNDNARDGKRHPDGNANYRLYRITSHLRRIAAVMLCLLTLGMGQL